jgi:hypothetical protein
VVTARVPTSETGVMQLRTGALSTSTVQAPHYASPQPNFGPFKPRSLRSA